MTCLMQPKLEAYLDAELSADELAGYEQHLRDCPACSSEALARLQLKRTIQAAARRYTPTPDFRSKIERMVSRPAKQRLQWMPAWGLAAALVAFAVLFGGGWWMRHSEHQQALAELADLHVATLASQNPVDVVSTDRHTVKPWFQGKLPFTFALPEVKNTPFTLVGGRLVYFQQNPGAEIIFGVRQHHLSLFVFQDRDDVRRLTSGFAKTEKAAFEIESWSDGGIRYILITDASRADVTQLADLIKAAARS